jgi:hypothetical protein
VAEIQLGDYNWFFEVPAQAGAWTFLHLRQRGPSLTCAVDGATVTAQPGAGLAPRPGRLSFYIRPGGTLEIAEARLWLADPP